MSSSKLDAVADVPASLPPSPSPPSSPPSLHKTSAGTSLEGVAPGGAVGQPVALQAAGAAAAVTSVRAVALSHRLTTAAFADTTSVAGPVFKVVLVGDVGTGKSTLQRSWASTCGAGTPSSAGGAASAAAPLPTALAAAYATHDTANTAHFEVLTVQEQGELCKVHVWDTPGAEKWRRLVSTYLRQSNAIVIMYDITRPATFESVRTHWLQDVKRHVPRGCLVLLLGTKADLRLPPSAPGAAAQVPAAAVAELCAATLQGVETESHEVCINSAADVQALLHHIGTYRRRARVGAHPCHAAPRLPARCPHSS
ncbi:GTP-binding protein, partial [archaeon]